MGTCVAFAPLDDGDVDARQRELGRGNVSRGFESRVPFPATRSLVGGSWTRPSRLLRFDGRRTTYHPPMAVSEYVSERGVNAGADQTPFLVYGHGSEDLAKHIATWSTLTCIAIQGLDDLRAVLASRPCIGVTAMSRPEAPGEAGV